MPQLPTPDSVNATPPVILLVDDLVTIRKLGKLILDQKGYTTLTAENGAEALAIYGEHRRGIDLVILDLNMPGISGVETWRRLREINPNVRVVIASGYSEESIAEDESARPEGFVIKPYTPDELVNTVRNALAGSD